MSNPPKYIEAGATYLVTSRTEEGLPFFPKRRYQRILKSIMARAQALYPVHVVAYILGENQLHQVLTAIEPANFPLFVGYVKQELAHAVNRIRGRKKKTIWCEGYDSPILLGLAEVLYYISYCYTQSQAANQVDTIEQCENPSSWREFSTDTYQIPCKRLYRTDFKKGIDEDDAKLADREEHVLTISPFAWREGLNCKLSDEEAKRAILNELRGREAELRKIRQEKNIPLRNTSPTPERMEKYVPKKFGKRMVCICWEVEYRIKFLTWFREQVRRCKEIYAKWCAGDFSDKWPPGFFPPRLPMTASTA